MPGIPELDTEALERMGDALGQPETPAAEKVGVEALKVGGLEKGMTAAPAVELDDDNLMVLTSIEKRFHAFNRCRAASAPRGSVQAAAGAVETQPSTIHFKVAVAMLPTLPRLPKVEGGEQLVVYVARPGKEIDFKENVFPDCQVEGMERRKVLKDETGNPVVVVFGPKKEKQAAPAAEEEAEDLSPLLTDTRDLSPEEQRKLINRGEGLVAQGNDDEASRYFQRVMVDATRESAEGDDALRLQNEISLRNNAAKAVGATTLGVPVAPEELPEWLGGSATGVGSEPELPVIDSPAPAVSAPAAETPVAGAPALPSADAPLPDWLISLRSSPAEPEASASVVPFADDPPEWLRPPAVSAPVVPVASLSVDVPPETAPAPEHPLRDPVIKIDPDSGIVGVFDDPSELIGREPLTDQEWKDRLERPPYGIYSSLDEAITYYQNSVEAHEEYLREHPQSLLDEKQLRYYRPILEKLMAEKQRREASVEPAAVSFAVRVEAARGLVEGAVKEAGLLPEKIAKGEKHARDIHALLSKDSDTEISDEEIIVLRQAREILNKKAKLAGSHEAIEKEIGLYDKYQSWMTEAATALRGHRKGLEAATKELKPGWFEKEPAVVREMAELQKFFGGFGNLAGIEQELTEARRTEETVNSNFKKLKLTDAQKRLAKENVTVLESQLAGLKSLDVNGLLARKDLPPQLRAAIEARRAGKQFDFGTGPVANFRREVYESVMGTLGIEAAPVVEVSEVAVPVAVAVPETKPATPAAPEPKPAAAPEKKVESTAESVAEKMKQPLSMFAKDLIAARGVKDEKERNKAFARITGEAQERLVRGFTDNPQGLRDELVGLPQNEQKQLLAILIGAVKSGKADPRLERFTKGLLEKKGLSAAEVSAGALGIFGKIIEWMTGMTVEAFIEQLKTTK